MRRLEIVDCLIQLKREDEARHELRSLYEDQSKPGYIIPGEANILLIDLETAHGYEDFEIWLKRNRPAQDEWSLQHITSLKKAIESGEFTSATALLEGIPL